jgi:MFS family permease
MARDDEHKSGRFTKASHTRHDARGGPKSQPPPPAAAPQPPADLSRRSPAIPRRPAAAPPPPEPRRRMAPPPVDDGFSRPKLHTTVPTPNTPDHPPAHPARSGPRALPPGPSSQPVSAADVTVTKAVVSRTRQLSKQATKKVIAASQADGAHESGLTALIWNQVLSYGADAMITVALAGTVFFAATGGQQRGNVLQYLLITMAPFALVAPVIGPVLDRMQHGRRIAMAATAIGRTLLALLMAAHFSDLYVLFPCALGSLVLSKAYSVIRVSAAPRLVPLGMTLVSANARLSVFGLGASVVGGSFIGIFIKVTGSYQWGLRLTAIGFAVTAFYAIRLPKQVDSANPATRHPGEPPRPTYQVEVASIGRLRAWAQRGFGEHVLVALQAQCALRALSGFLTLFLAFYIQSSAHGVDALLDLAGLGIAAGGGTFIGTAVGARLTLGRPEVLVVACASASAVMGVVTALMFSTPMAIAFVAVSAIANALSKLSLDAIVQRDVVESLRSSAFARSETFLQLAWVCGAAFAALLPAGRGQLDLGLAALLLALAVTVIVLRTRVVSRRTSGHRYAT